MTTTANDVAKAGSGQLSIEALKIIEEFLEPRDADEESMDLFRRSYIGGEEYRGGNYLVKHEKELKVAYKRRMKEATYTNYCAPVIDIMNDFLYRERPARSLEKTANGNPALTEFINDADMMGRDFATLMAEISRWASVYGHMGVVIDKPISNEAVSRAQELDFGVRPYMTKYMPSDIINWEFENTYNGPPVLATLALRETSVVEGEEVFRIWTRTTWQLFRRVAKKNGTGKAEISLIDSGDHPLKLIPFVLVRNKDNLESMEGISTLVDIAETNRYIYRLDSAAFEVIGKTAFPFLEMPVDTRQGAVVDDAGEDIVIGTSNVLERDIDDRVGHRWIEPSHGSLQRMLEWRTQAVADIREMAKMGGVSDSTRRQGAGAYSGTGMEVKFQQMNAVLSSKATLMERAETNILKFVLMWENKPTDNVSVRYPRKFGIRDAITDLDSALRAKELVISPVYDKLIQKSIAARSLSDLGYSKDEIEETKQDIDKYEYVPTASQLSITGGMNGVNVIQTKESGQNARTTKVIDTTRNKDTATDGANTDSTSGKPMDSTGTDAGK